jgi:hypothetical protein
MSLSFNAYCQYKNATYQDQGTDAYPVAIVEQEQRHTPMVLNRLAPAGARLANVLNGVLK